MTVKPEIATVVILLVASGGTLAERLWVVDPAYGRRDEQRLDADVLGSPGSRTIQFLSLEHPLAASDLVWLAIVQQLGQPSNAMTDGHWDRVQRWTDIAVDFDPRYFAVYHSVGMNLSLWAHRLDASDSILLRGYRALPARWELPMTLAYNAYFVRGDARLGSDYMAEAAAIPGAPKFLAPLAGRMRYHAGDEMGAIALLEEMALHMTGPALEEVDDRIKLLKGELRLRVYDEACERYHAVEGRFPRTAEDVAAAGYTNVPTTDYFGDLITFDAGTCVARTPNVTVRETEAAQRVGSSARGESTVATSTASNHP